MKLKRFNEAAAAYRESGKLEGQRAKAKVVEEIKKAPADRAVKAIPTAEAIRSLSDGVARYRTESVDVGIYKKGESYVLHDFNTDTTTREIDAATVDSALAGVRNNGENADISELMSINQENMQVSGSRRYSYEGKANKEKKQSNFLKDKYYERQIDNLENLTPGGYITVGKVVKESPLNKVGVPEGRVYFDVSKILKEMRTRRDPIPTESIKQIPDLLDHPIVITEYIDQYGTPSASVYGNLFIGTSPVVVGVVVKHTQKGVLISKIQTVHPNRNALNDMADNNILYLSENKKETKSWFQSLGTQVLPLGGKQFGFIRSISQEKQKINTSDENSSEKSSKEKIAELKERIDKKKIDAYCRENIEEYASMSAANQSMIRQIVREGRVYGLDDADILSYARVAARSGLNIVYDENLDAKGIAGAYDPENNRIVVN
ncbi:MAG: hypothetical protein IKC34_01010, partial [Clostridia bacterium]|nr:hypothetical protein [Clostridia bacterium]